MTRRLLALSTGLVLASGCFRPELLAAQSVTAGTVVCAAGRCTLPLTVKPDTVRLVRVDTVIRFITRVDTILRVDTVRIGPVAVVLRPDFTATCTGLTCVLDGSTSTGVALRYSWNLNKSPDGTAVGKVVTVTYAEISTRNVVLTITDSAGKTASVGKTLQVVGGTVTPPPVTPPPPPPVVTPPPPPPVTPPIVTALGPHPRVWMTPERITRLQAQVTANTVRWQNVKRIADAGVAVNVVPDMCLAYLATGDVSYAQRAGALLADFAVPTNDLKYDSGYGYRFWLPVVSMGLDWCYNGLTPAQRTQIAGWLMDRSDWVWPETNPARVGGWGTASVAINYYWGFMMTGPAALAADGLDPRAATHRALALTKYTTVAVPFFASGGAGGAWDEGTNYESTWRVGSFVDAFATSGIPLDASFLTQSVQWRIQSTMPGNRYKIPFGSQPRASDASLYSYDRMHLLYALPFAGSATAAAYGWLDAIGQAPQSEFNETAMLADEFLRYDPAQPKSLGTLPKGYTAPGPGFAVYRQSWTDPNATVLAFESGPAGNAGARNANGLMIWKGSFWISATANLTSASGIEMGSSNYNNLTVGGVGQYLFPGNGGTMAPPIYSDSLVVWQGQAKNTYGYQNEWGSTRFVDDFSRTIAYLPLQDVIVVVDRVTVKDATAAKVFRWHSQAPAVIAGQSFTLSNPAGTARCVATVSYPADAVLADQPIGLGQAGALSSSAVTITLPARASDVVVTVFQCGAPVPLSAVVSAATATVTLGGRVVIVPLSESQPITTRSTP